MAEENNVSNWFQDNLRIIISVGIVILLVFAIYSYSQRNSRTTVVVDDSHIDEVATVGDASTNEINEIIDEIQDDQENTELPDTATTKAPTEAEEVKTDDTTQNAHIAAEEPTEDETPATEEASKKEEEPQKAEDIVREVIESHAATQQQTHHEGGVVKIVAVRGDSMTTLARKAAKDYMSRNTVGNITPSHKIYIEDYLRKHHVSRHINVNTEVRFTESEIAEAIAQSQKLTDAELRNLARYAQHVPGL